MEYARRQRFHVTTRDDLLIPVRGETVAATR